MDNIIDTTPSPEAITAYCYQLKQQIKLARMHMLDHMRTVLSPALSQQDIRGYSWMYCETYSTLATEHLPEGLTLPLAIGASAQDATHQSHFIRAYLLSLNGPFTSSRIRPITATNICSIEHNELVRLEASVLVYSKLLNAKPTTINQVEPDRLDDLQRQIDELSEQVKALASRRSRRT